MTAHKSHVVSSICLAVSSPNLSANLDVYLRESFHLRELNETLWVPTGLVKNTESVTSFRLFLLFRLH